MEDWYKPLDPRQFYYATYNIARANMNQSVERNFAFVEERGLIEKLSADARSQIEHGLLPLRHLHWGSNMNMTEICQRGYGTRGHRALHLLGRRSSRHGADRLAASASNSTARPA